MLPNDGEMPLDLGFSFLEMMPWGHFCVPPAWAEEGERWEGMRKGELLEERG